MNKILFCIIIVFIHCQPSSQIRYRFNIAAEYGFSTSNQLDKHVGGKIAEYYQPFQDLDLFGGVAFQILKVGNLKAPLFPLGLSLGYFDTKHAIGPIMDFSFGFNIFKFSDSSKTIVLDQEGKYFSDFSIGIGYNKWKSIPYITAGISNFTFTQSSHLVGDGTIEKNSFNKRQLTIKVGFLMK